MGSLATLAAAALMLTAPHRAAEVASGLGINIHIEYTDGGYRDPARVLACLDYLDVHTVRDAAPNPRNQGQKGYAVLARAGVTFDLFVNGKEIAPAVARIAELSRAFPGSVIAIEGVNEVNNHPGFTYAGERDLHRAGVAYQAAQYSRGKATGALAGVPVVDLTDYPSHSGRSDAANLHSYPHGDSAPASTLSPAIAVAAAQPPERPVIVTELGYSTARGRPGVSELAQARLLLVSLLDAAAAGVQRSYVYQLLDAYPDPAGADAEKHYGLFRLDYTPKPAARMLHMITALYADPSADASRFTLRPAQVRVTGGGADVRTLVVQKTDGEIVVAVWRDVPVYDFGLSDDRRVATTPVDLTLPSKHGQVIINDPVALTRGMASLGAAATRLSLGADPLIVQVLPGGGPRT